MAPAVGHACATCGGWFLFAHRAAACREAHIPALAAVGAVRRAAYAEHRRAWRAGLERWLANGRPDHLAVWLP